MRPYHKENDDDAYVGAADGAFEWYHREKNIKNLISINDGDSHYSVAKETYDYSFIKSNWIEYVSVYDSHVHHSLTHCPTIGRGRRC